MSTSPSPSRGNPTRQQLDELDALLQRMLSLPLSQLDDSPPAAETPPPASARTTSVPRTPPPADPPAPAPTLQRPTAPAPTPPPRPAARPATSSPTERPWKLEMPATVSPSPGSWSVTPAGAAPRPESPSPAEPLRRVTPSPLAPPDVDPTAGAATAVLTMPAPPDAPVAPPPRPAPAGVRMPLGMRVLASADEVVFRLLGRLGPVGRALGRPAGRDLLGITGLLALAGAGLWLAADWFGWTW
jgi:hypothetical protein